jgi:pimeloyl-ACP methyl ester carboxylesterase
VFLPGAAGDAEFWRPVADRLPADRRTVLLNWPGAGDEPPDPGVRSVEHLIALAARNLGDEADVVAQSMGGVVALALAARHPEKVRRLVLVATSGGIDVAGVGGADWREEYRAEYPHAAPWITGSWPDATDQVRTVTAPTLLIWGDADPISPVPVGEQLHGLLRASTLRVIAGGTHSLARDHPDEVAALIADHLG